MKITKSIEEINYYKELQEKANEGCYACPGCGATGVREWNEYNDGTKNIKHSKYIKNYFFRGLHRTDYYECSKCGCEWQSEEYPIKP